MSEALVIKDLGRGRVVLFNLLWMVVSGISGSICAQETPGPLRVIRAEQVDGPPLLDGRLEEEFWKRADWQGDFTQLKPDLGEPAQAPTRFAAAFNRTHIYVAIRSSNPNGPKSNSRITRRDGNMDQDNAVTVYLDTFHTRRDCYYFSTNSLGTQVDGRIGEDGRTNDKSWDCNWAVVSREDEEGWTTEMAIPVKEIRIPSGTEMVWGINVRRNYPELLETSYWTPRDQAWRVSQSGDLIGLGTFKKDFSASIVPYLLTYRTNTPGTGQRTFYSSCNNGGEMGSARSYCNEAVTGADFLFNVGSSVNGNFTVNPDFATVEADEETVNLTRYETFYPEKRLYFLEGAELFTTPINVFYSRRIGFIDWGAKANGRLGKYNFSGLSVHEGSFLDELSSQNTVFRLQRDIFSSSNIGLMYVERNYSGGYNRVLSGDGNIHFLNDGKVTAQFIGSFPSGGKSTKAMYISASRGNEIYDYQLAYRSIDPGFKDNVNAIGFIVDDDRHQLQGSASYKWWVRNRTVERVNFSGNSDVFWSHKGDLRNANFTSWNAVTFTNRILVGATVNYHLEVFEKRFYNHQYLVETGYNLQQWNNYSFFYVRGRSFDRDFDRWVFRSHFKLTNNWALEYSFQHVNLEPDPDGQSTTLQILTTDYNFTPDLFLRLFTQYNSANSRFYLYGLFGWRFIPPFGTLYVGYTADQFDLVDAPFERDNQRTLFVKLRLPIELIR